MQDEPASLPKTVLTDGLRVRWGIDVQSFEYAPLGAGSYHWIATAEDGRRLFVTADRLNAPTPDANFANLEAAFLAATALKAAGLDGVVAPIASLGGRAIERLLPEWAVAVLPFIEGTSSNSIAWTNPAVLRRRAAAAELIGRLHRTRPPSELQKWDVAISLRAELEEALTRLDQPWSGGPFAEPTRQLLASSHDGLVKLLKRYDLLARAVASSEDAWVVTHGEPHAANFIDGADGTLYLIDWDTVRLAPRERDLWLLIEDDREALAAYQATAGPVAPRPEFMELFDLRWQIQDISINVDWFRQPHGESEDDLLTWKYMGQYLPIRQ